MNRDFFVKIAIKLGIYPQMMKLDNRIQMHKQNKAFSVYIIRFSFSLEILPQAEVHALSP